MFKGRGRAETRVNATYSTGQSAEETRNPATSGDLTSEQWTAILSLLNSCKPGTDEKMTGKKNLTWIIDFGATQHMTGNSGNLTSLKRILGCPIGLHNGN